MAHTEQRDFFKRVQAMFPRSFKDVRALDCGSLDINGCLKGFFTGKSTYLGVDIVQGPNVNLVSRIHELPTPILLFDTVVSAEMLEHDEFWERSLVKMYTLLKPGGLMVISCAGPTRHEHGTYRVSKGEKLYGTSPDYYRNLSQQDITSTLMAETNFQRYEASGRGTEDTYFWGVKRNDG